MKIMQNATALLRKTAENALQNKRAAVFTYRKQTFVVAIVEDHVYQIHQLVTYTDPKYKCIMQKWEQIGGSIMY